MLMNNKHVQVVYVEYWLWVSLIDNDNSEEAGQTNMGATQT